MTVAGNWHDEFVRLDILANGSIMIVEFIFSSFRFTSFD